MGKDNKTTFDVNATEHTRGALGAVQKNLGKTSKEANTLSSRFRAVARATVVMEGPLGGTAGRFSAIATLLNSVNLGAVGAGVAFTALTAGVYKSLTRFAEFEKQQLKTNQLLEQTGYAAGLTSKELDTMAKNLGISTLESVQGAREAQAILLTFRGIGVDSFERTMKAAADLSAVTGQSLKQSVVQLGKALEDPATNMSNLRRNGVSFTNSQKEMIVAMQDAGNAAGAQATLLGLLEGQMGGAGTSAAGGLAGAADTLAERWGLMLEKFAQSGAGQVATRMLNTMAEALEWVNELLDPENAVELIKVQKQITENQKTINLYIEENKRLGVDAHRTQITGLLQQNGELIRKKRNLEAAIEAEKQAIKIAREKSKVTQEQISLDRQAEAARAAAKKAREEADKQFEKDSKASSAYAAKLVDEENRFRMSLMNKSLAEDAYYEERKWKLIADAENGLITTEEYNAAQQANESLHQQKLTEIARIEGEKRAKDVERLERLKARAVLSTAANLASLMRSSSKKLFNIGKASAIAAALINTYQAVTKTMASTPYPFNIPLAASQLVAGMMQVQNIKSQTFSPPGRQMGGPVIAGRSYLVGERGPELFTPSGTGQIINNNTVSNLGGATNTINVYNTVENGDAFVARQASKIWNVIVDRMNEEGLRFA